MSGPQRPGFAGKVTVTSAGEDSFTLTTKDEGLIAYLKDNGDSYIASFTPVGSDSGGEDTEAPTS